MINEIILAAANPVITNIWAVDLPPEPEFPAVVFDVETIAEDTWVQGGGYDQHTVTFFLFAESLDELMVLVKAINFAIEVLPQYLRNGESGDSTYEEMPELFTYYTTHILRTPRY